MSDAHHADIAPGQSQVYKSDLYILRRSVLAVEQDPRINKPSVTGPPNSTRLLSQKVLDLAKKTYHEANITMAAAAAELIPEIAEGVEGGAGAGGGLGDVLGPLSNLIPGGGGSGSTPPNQTSTNTNTNTGPTNTFNQGSTFGNVNANVSSGGGAAPAGSGAGSNLFAANTALTSDILGSDFGEHEQGGAGEHDQGQEGEEEEDPSQGYDEGEEEDPNQGYDEGEEEDYGQQ